MISYMYLHTLLLPFTICFVFFSNETPSTYIYTLSLHDALPIFGPPRPAARLAAGLHDRDGRATGHGHLLQLPVREEGHPLRSEEHTSELQSLRHLVCRLLLEKKKET